MKHGPIDEDLLSFERFACCSCLKDPVFLRVL
mgnify:CR=1 FL=1